MTTRTVSWLVLISPWCRCTEAMVLGLVLLMVRTSAAKDVELLVLRHVWKFQNLPTACDQRFQAATSYSLIKPPRTGRRRILPWTGSGTGDVGRGGRICSARCGRAVL